MRGAIKDAGRRRTAAVRTHTSAALPSRIDLRSANCAFLTATPSCESLMCGLNQSLYIMSTMTNRLRTPTTRELPPTLYAHHTMVSVQSGEGGRREGGRGG